MSGEVTPLKRFEPILNLRAVNTSGFIYLIKLLAESEPVSYTNLYQIFSHSPVTTKKGKPFSNSSYYHQLEAAKVLGLVEQAGRGKSYSLTSSGRDLAEIIQVDRRNIEEQSESLTTQEKELLRKLIITNPLLNKAFFWLFRGLDNELALEEGLPVTLVTKNTAGEKSEQSRTKKHYNYEVTSKFCPSFTLNTISSQAIILGLRTWLIDLGILDEMTVAPRNNISGSEVQILFPVRAVGWTNLEQFENKMLPYFWKLAEHQANYWQVSVPALLYELCPGEHISVQNTKITLMNWLEKNRSFTSSTLFSPSIAMRAWIRKPGDYNRLLKGYLQTKQGYISHLSILSEALSKGTSI